MPKAWASSITTSTDFCPSSFWRSSSLVGADQVDHGAVREPSRSAITGAALLPGRLVLHGHGVRSPIASRSHWLTEASTLSTRRPAALRVSIFSPTESRGALPVRSSVPPSTEPIVKKNKSAVLDLSHLES